MSETKNALRTYPCAICGCANKKVVLRKRGVVFDAVFTIVRCSDCRHVYVDPRIRDDQLDSIYDDDYYHGNGFDRGIDFYADPSPSLRQSIDQLISTVVAISGPRAELAWLDYGCGAGNLLARVAAQGISAYGYDLGQPARALCQTKGLTVLSDAELSHKSGTFDVVTAIEVIEHVADPRAFLRHLVNLLKVGGILYLQTGNWNFVRHVSGSPYVMPEGHIQYFTPTSMRRLFAETGVDEVDALNTSWIGFKLTAALPMGFQIARVAERITRRLLPGYSQFPIGIRSR